MRSDILVFLLVTLLVGCHSTDSLEPVEPAVCNDPKYSRTDTFTDVETTIKAVTIYSTMGATVNYCINQPGSLLNLLPWVPCNLPQAYQQDSLAIRVSGYTLTYPTIENDQSTGAMYGYPIELTRIEKK